MSASRWWIAIGVSLSVQAYVLYFCLHYGTLIGLLQWDDCVIILRGFQNLDQLAHAQLGFGLVQAVHHLEIHAPLSDVQTMIGLLISGGGIWGPYLLNAVWLALTLAALLCTFDRRNWLLATLVVVLVVSQPLTLNALSKVKSDWSGGLLMAGALFLLARGTQTARENEKLLGAALLGLATISKLTAFYLPVVAIAALLLFEWHSAMIGIRSQSAEASGSAGKTFARTARLAFQALDRRALALRLAIGVGPFVFFFIYKLKANLGYIRSATTGTVWLDGLTVFGRAQYYGPYGPDSWMEWGNLHLYFVVFASAALLLAWRRKEQVFPLALLVLALVGVMLLLPLVVASTSNHSFASTLLGVVLAATLVSVDYLMRTLRSWSGLMIAAVALLIALPVAWPLKNTSYYSLAPVSNAELRELSSTYSKIVDFMITHAHRDSPHVVVFYDDLFAPHPNLAIEYFHRTGQLLSIDRVDDLSDKSWTAELPTADFVLTIVPGPSLKGRVIPELFPEYPISRDPGRAEDVVRGSGQFVPVGVFGVRGAEIHLYANVH